MKRISTGVVSVAPKGAFEPNNVKHWFSCASILNYLGNAFLLGVFQTRLVTIATVLKYFCQNIEAVVRISWWRVGRLHVKKLSGQTIAPGRKIIIYSSSYSLYILHQWGLILMGLNPHCDYTPSVLNPINYYSINDVRPGSVRPPKVLWKAPFYCGRYYWGHTWAMLQLHEIK